MCSCQDCNPIITKQPHCRQCVRVFEPSLSRSRVTAYHKLVPNFEWDCKYCHQELRSFKSTRQPPPDLEDILGDISKLKQKLGTLLKDVNEVKTDLVDLKTTAASTYTYMRGVNGKVRRLEERIVKLDKSSSNFQDLQQTLAKFEHHIGDKNAIKTNNNNLKYNANEMQYYDVVPVTPTGDELTKDQGSFIAKFQCRMKNAPKRLWSTFLTDSNKKTSLLRCEV